jgi:hypothetical protein
MPVPWGQIVRLMPSILEVSRELMQRSRRTPGAQPSGVSLAATDGTALETRVRALEENERNQAELVTNMAEQLAQLTTAVAALHIRARRLLIGQAVTAVIAVLALALAFQ